jgi:hypothetical protein
MCDRDFNKGRRSTTSKEGLHIRAKMLASTLKMWLIGNVKSSALQESTSQFDFYMVVPKVSFSLPRFGARHGMVDAVLWIRRQWLATGTTNLLGGTEGMGLQPEAHQSVGEEFIVSEPEGRAIGRMGKYVTSMVLARRK